MIDLDLSDPINQVRVLIGDIDSLYISDANISYFLTQNSDNVLKAATEAIFYLLGTISHYVREEAGDVEVYWSDLYNQLHKRYEDLKRDARYSSGLQLFKFGGTTASEVKRVKNDPESCGIGISKEDFSTILEKYNIDPENPYLIKRY